VRTIGKQDGIFRGGSVGVGSKASADVELLSTLDDVKGMVISTLVNADVASADVVISSTLVNADSG